MNANPSSSSSPVVPSFGSVDTGAGGGTAAPAAPTTPAPVSGPAAAGLNPGVGPAPSFPTTGSGPGQLPELGTSNPSLPANIASQYLVGGGTIGGTAATAPKPYDEKQIVTELAGALNIDKPPKGSSIEQAVVDELARKYGVKIEGTSEGTGNKQGAIGRLRHGIAAWFDSEAKSGAGKLTTKQDQPGSLGDQNILTPKKQHELADADKIKNPRIRQQAIEAALGTSPFGALRNGILEKQKQPGQGEQGVPSGDVQNQSELASMVGEIAKKLGLKTGSERSELTEIAENAQKEGLSGSNLASQTPGTPATPGGQQTAGQAYVAFTKSIIGTNGALSQYGVQAATDLENAGYLDKSANAGSPTPQQVASAYQKLVTDAVNNHKSLNDQMAANQQANQVQNGPTSEASAYVQGVATEFGVYLTPDQITSIANTYAPTAAATAAGVPITNVEDEIKDAVVALYNPGDPRNPTGLANTMYEDIKQAALQYQIPISDAQIGSMVKSDIANATVESLFVAADAAQAKAEENFQNQAAGLYPTLATQIKAGNTVQNLVAPYFTLAEQYTGVPSSTMQADDPSGKWSAFLQGGKDPKTGAPTTMTLDQWKKTLMQDPRYGFQNTTGAKDMASQMTSALLNEFGLVTTGGSTQGSGGFGAYTGSPGTGNTTG